MRFNLPESTFAPFWNCFQVLTVSNDNLNDFTASTVAALDRTWINAQQEKFYNIMPYEHFVEQQNVKFFNSPIFIANQTAWMTCYTEFNFDAGITWANFNTALLNAVKLGIDSGATVAVPTRFEVNTQVEFEIYKPKKPVKPVINLKKSIF